MLVFYFHTWRTQEYDHMDDILRYLATLLVCISVNVSGWWLLLFFRCYVLVVAGRWVSPNSKPIVGAAFPRPSSREGSWIVHGFCSAVSSGDDKRLCVTEGWKEQVRNKGKIDDLPVEFCAWVVSQYFFVSLLHLSGISDPISNIRPLTDTWWF